MDEGIVSFSPDGQTMYLTKARRSPTSNTSVEIYTSRRNDATWGAASKYRNHRRHAFRRRTPCRLPDGKYLYFTSGIARRLRRQGHRRVAIGERIGSLENLGPEIDTPGDEMFPYLRADTLLYFSSDGHPGFGGLGMFKATLNSTRDRWSVENLGLPMNSAGDDFGITFGPGESGFFSSNRGDRKGYDHIYSFELPELKVTISGWVMDKDEEPVPKAVIRIVGDDGSNRRKSRATTEASPSSSDEG